jgi:hypothetical protein
VGVRHREFGVDQSFKSVAIDDGHSFALNADPALARKLVERFGYGLAGAAEPICDALVRPTLSHRRPYSLLALSIGEQKISDA